MDQVSTTIGLDIGDKYCDLCVLDHQTGDELEQARVATTPTALQRWFSRSGRARVVLEVGGHAGWVSRLLDALGHEVLVADARKARRLMGDEQKDDQLDAALLARFGRADPALLNPIKLRSEQTQQELAVLRSRDSLVAARTQLINHVRGAVKAMGRRLPVSSSESFHRMAGVLPEGLVDALKPTMTAIEGLTQQIRQLDRTIEAMCEQYPQIERLRQISGVGPITAAAFVLIIEDPTRFEKSRQVGAYLGLCRRRWRSGQSDPELRISKSGDQLLRRLLVQCAHYVLGAHAPDSDLKRWGQAYAQRGGRAAKKRAVVAVARKLAVLMHHLWSRSVDYEPLYRAQRLQAQPAN